MAKDATTKQAEPKAETPKKERKVLTPEQRIAKLEADLKAAREKAEAKARKASDQLREQRAKLVEKRDELDRRIKAIDEDLAAAGAPVTDTAPNSDAPVDETDAA